MVQSYNVHGICALAIARRKEIWVDITALDKDRSLDKDKIARRVSPSLVFPEIVFSKRRDHVSFCFPEIVFSKRRNHGTKRYIRIYKCDMFVAGFLFLRFGGRDLWSTQ